MMGCRSWFQILGIILVWTCMNEEVLVWSAVPTPLKLSDKIAWLNDHNSVRCDAGATTMPALIWDAALEQVAQEFANTCPGGHNANRQSRYGTISGMGGSPGVGENYAAGYQTAIAVDGGWASEKPSMGGHYTQMVWANTLRVGCAKNTVDCSGSGSFGTYWLCDYYPAGNYVGQQPFSTSGGANPNVDACLQKTRTTFPTMVWTNGKGTVVDLTNSTQPPPTTPAPTTPAPATSAPATQAPATPAPTTPAPATPAPATPAPTTPAPAPATPAATPAPATPAPTTPAPTTPTPTTPAPVTPAPSTPAPSATPAPSTPAPSSTPASTNSPATPAPATKAPSATPASTASPATSNPATTRPPSSTPSPNPTSTPSSGVPTGVPSSTPAPSSSPSPTPSGSTTKTPTTSPGYPTSSSGGPLCSSPTGCDDTNGQTQPGQADKSITSGGGSTINMGMVIGVIAGSAAALIVLVVLGVCWYRRRESMSWSTDRTHMGNYDASRYYNSNPDYGTAPLSSQSSFPASSGQPPVNAVAVNVYGAGATSTPAPAQASNPTHARQGTMDNYMANPALQMAAVAAVASPAVQPYPPAVTPFPPAIPKPAGVTPFPPAIPQSRPQPGQWATPFPQSTAAVTPFPSPVSNRSGPPPVPM